ncbi:MAG: response regulator transcription factor [Campylobacteraceae bacterium]|nr:response regulator transcription factor [Campylobacteraceae bacterium]
MTNTYKSNILKTLSILYIEDEENIRNNITSTLKLLVNNVFSVSSYDEAIIIIKNENINIIISDINLPGKSGLDFCKHIRENDTKIPIVLLTAYLDTNYLLDATKLKLVDYLIKPISFDALHIVLIKCVDELILQNMFKIKFMNNNEFDINNKILIDIHNKEIKLTLSELNLLEYLIKNSSRIISHEELKQNIRKDIEDTSDSALKNLLNKLRKKIGKESINNISGIGFRLFFKH